MKLTMRKSDGLDDWFLIEKAEHEHRGWFVPTEFGRAYQHSGRISDADVEGDAAEMRAIARAIQSRSSVGFKRCAVEVMGDSVDFWSPRNSQTPGTVTLAEADALAAEILATLPEAAE